jgi:DNA-directed RNA polymerase specialized sigma24 family protein
MSDSCDATHVIQETFQNCRATLNARARTLHSRIRVFRTAVSTIRNRQRWWSGEIDFFIRPPDPGEQRALVRHGLYCLSRSHRLILVLRDIEGLTYSEISEVLELPAGTVKTRLMRARTRMLNSVMQSRAQMADRDQ